MQQIYIIPPFYTRLQSVSSFVSLSVDEHTLSSKLARSNDLNPHMVIGQDQDCLLICGYLCKYIITLARFRFNPRIAAFLFTEGAFAITLFTQLMHPAQSKINMQQIYITPHFHTRLQGPFSLVSPGYWAR